MIRTIYFFTLLFLSLFVSILTLPWIKYLELRGKTKERNKFIYTISHGWAKFVLKISGANIIVKGHSNIPKDETVLFVANHQSNFDIPLMMGTIDMPKGFIAKKELESWPIISMWMKYIRCIFMDRSNIRKSAEAIVEGINLLKDGYSMVIFPEGTRCKSGKGEEFKAGSFKLALKPKVTIIPVSIDGSYKLLEANGGKIKSENVNITIHQPINTKNLTKEEISELPKKVENIIKNSLQAI